MKLTKFVHACVLVDDGHHVGLFDPGEFSWKSGLFNIDQLPKLDYIMITHEHPDHFFEPFVDTLIAKFPDVMFFSTSDVVSKLKKKGVQKALSMSHNDVSVRSLNHEALDPLADHVPQNVMIHFKDKITHPGDSHHVPETKDILFLPLDAPWGSTIEAVRMAIRLKPKAVLPIHDWMLRDEWRETMYGRLENTLERYGIQFLWPTDGKSIEVKV